MESSFLEKRTCSELEVQYAWSRLGKGTLFTCTDGKRIEVIYPGRWNFEGGPDFLNAKIKIDGFVLSGDIEIHNNSADWFLHGHDKDTKYHNVILHVVKLYSAARKAFPVLSIPTVVFPDSSLIPFKQDGKNEYIKKYHKGFCADRLSQLEPVQLSRFLCNFGENRLNKKTIIFINEILDKGAEQTFLIHLFEAFGYKNNRQAFMNLYRRISTYDASSYGDIEFEAVIWGESGFLPSKGILKCDNQMQAYVSALWNCWWKNRKELEGLPEIVWAKSAGRPGNTPWRRIAGLIVLLRKLGHSPLNYLLSFFSQDLNKKEIVNELINMFSCKDEKFGMYSNFNAKLKKTAFLIGRSRAIEIIGNIIIPFFYAYSKIKKDSNLEKFILEIWENIPATRSNNISLRVSFERWQIDKNKIREIAKSFAAEQGIIFIFKNLCEYLQMNCKECLVNSNL